MINYVLVIQSYCFLKVIGEVIFHPLNDCLYEQKNYESLTELCYGGDVLALFL